MMTPVLARPNYVQRFGMALFTWFVMLAADEVRALDNITTLSVTNYTGYLIDSDADTNNAAYNRESILGRVITTANNSTSTTNRTYNSVVSVRFADKDGNFVPLLVAAGVTNTVVNFTNAINTAAGGTQTATNGFSLLPTTRLGFVQNYRVQATVSGQFAGTGSNDTYRSYLHFTNRVPTNAAFSAIALVTNPPTWNKLVAVATDTNRNAFRVSVAWNLWRYDNYTTVAGITTTNVPLRFNWQLRDDLGTTIALATNVINTNAVAATYVSGPPRVPYATNGTIVLPIKPAAGVVLDSINRTYRLFVTIAVTNTPGQAPELMNTNFTSLTNLVHFSGQLDFGPVQTMFTKLHTDPTNLPPITSGLLASLIQVTNQSGYVIGATNFPGTTNYTYGNGQTFGVYLQSNGVALFTTNQVGTGIGRTNAVAVLPTINGTNLGNISGVYFIPSSVTLNHGGAKGTVVTLLPAGFGIHTNTGTRRYFSTVTFSNVSMGESLIPSAATTFPGPLLGVCDSHPIVFLASALVWTPQVGAFSLTTPIPAHVATYEYTQTNGDRPGNHWAYQSLSLTPPAFITVGTSNGTAQLYADLDFKPAGGKFTAHFPYGTPITWTNGGQIRIRDGQISQTNGGSFLTGVKALPVGYPGDCIGCGTSSRYTNITLAATSQQLLFTRDGGLIANGTVITNKSPAWGYIAATNNYAHRLEAFTNGSFHMPGHSLRYGEDSLPGDSAGGVLLLTGVDADNLDYLERPDYYNTPNFTSYREGLADYAGLNLAALTDYAKHATSVLAGVKVNGWSLGARSKYYFRPGGVSGIHEAAPNGFPASGVALYGYSTTISNFSLSFLDSENKDSRTIGSLALPYPSSITQDFSNLKFSCPGGLLSAVIPNSSGYKRLQYWQADILPQSLTFASPEECDSTTGFLMLGVQAHASQFSATLGGTLGFKTDGAIMSHNYSESVGLTGLDSRLKLGNNATFDGPNGELYHFTPSADCYLNHYGARPASGAGSSFGWMNLAGTIAVPFFDDLKVHIHTGAKSNDITSAMYLMGGWPRTTNNPNRTVYGWIDNKSLDFFTNPDFDQNNHGWPNALTLLNDYRNSATETYHPRAQRLWLDLVNFDYPLAWSSATRSFASFGDTSTDLLVLNLWNQINYMSAEKLDITFGLQYDGLPQISLANIAYDLVEDTTGFAKSLTDAVSDAARQAMNDGLNDLDTMLDDLPEKLFDPVLDATLDPTIAALQQQLSIAATNTIPTNWPATVANLLGQYVQGTVPGVSTNVNFKLRNLATLNTNVAGLVKDFNDRLARIDAMIATNRYIIAETPAGSGHRSVGSNLVNKIVGNLAPQYLNTIAGSALDALLVNADPTFDATDRTLASLQSEVRTIRTGITNSTGLGPEMNYALNAGLTQINRATTNAANDILAFLRDIQDDIPYYSPAELQEEIRRRIDDAFFSEQVSADIQQISRAWFHELDSAIREASDSALAQFNRTMRDLISQSLAGVDDTINDALGEVNEKIGAGRISGYAHFKGDSLDEARVDARWRWRVPDDLKFDGYMIIREFNAEGDDTCYTVAGKSSTEVTIGALDIGLEWIAPDLRADVEGKFSFNSTGLIGLGGSFDTTGEFSLQDTFVVKNLAATCFFGATENYLGAAADIKMNSYEVGGALFFGHACSIEPLKKIDPDIGSLIKDGEFTGAYAFGRVSVPVTEVALGVPCSCLFCVTASMGAGVGYRAEGHEFIGKMEAGVSGEALCVVNIYGDLVLAGSISDTGTRFKGTGTIGGCLGHKPLRICHDFSVTLTYADEKWKVDHKEK